MAPVQIGKDHAQTMRLQVNYVVAGGDQQEYTGLAPMTHTGLDGNCRRILQPGAEIGSRQRLGEQVALHHITAHLGQ